MLGRWSQHDTITHIYTLKMNTDKQLIREERVKRNIAANIDRLREVKQKSH